MSATPPVPQSDANLRRKRSWWNLFRHRVYRLWRSILTVNDTPHRIAWGVAIGTLVAYLPIVGIQMIVGTVLCLLLRGNIIASLPVAWITNPVTIVPIYYVLYLLGSLFTGDEMITYALMEQTMREVNQAGIFSAEGINRIISLLGDMFAAMFIGGCIVGMANGAIFYFLVRALVQRYQERRDALRCHWRGRLEPQDCDNVTVLEDDQSASHLG